MAKSLKSIVKSFKSQEELANTVKSNAIVARQLDDSLEGGILTKSDYYKVQISFASELIKMGFFIEAVEALDKIDKTYFQTEFLADIANSKELHGHAANVSKFLNLVSWNFSSSLRDSSNTKAFNIQHQKGKVLC
jgi:hypothetical protein